MKKVIRKRAKNGTTMWKLSVMDTKTGKVVVNKVRATYDEMTAKLHRIRSKNLYYSVCAEEMHKWGGKVKEDGRAIALDSLEDEKLISESKGELKLKDILVDPITDDEL